MHPQIEKTCKECSRVFTLRNNNRNKVRQFCSRLCSTTHNGKNNKGNKHTQEWKDNMAKLNTGSNNSFYGKKHSQETKDKISKANKGNICANKGQPRPWQVGDKNPACRPEVRAWISKRVKETHWDCSGENNPNYIDGRSWKKYPQAFNQKLRDKIRDRDGHVCKKCGMNEDVHIEENKQKLHTHHIDYDKQHNDASNLITLCIVCNSEVNKDRTKWTAYFRNIILKTEGNNYE